MRKNWTISSLLNWTTEYFKKRGFANPRVDTEILLSHSLKIPRIELYAQFDKPLKGEELSAFKKLIQMRVENVPVQYITGHQGFRYIDLIVGPGVLIPRPETELIVDIAKELVSATKKPMILDIGTGSGAIALSIASELPQSFALAIDRSDEALQIAERNLVNCGLENVELLRSDLFSNIPGSYRGSFDLVVSNPPYIDQTSFGDLPAEIRLYEPTSALVSGETGLEVIDRIIERAPDWMKTGGQILLEIGGSNQAEIVKDSLSGVDRLAFEAIHQDLGGADRFIQMKKL